MGWFGHRGPALADDWEELVRRHVAVWRELDERERELLAGHLAHLVETKRWEAAAGFELNDRIRTVIAAQAALPVLELGVDAYDHVRTIIVHPATMAWGTERHGPAGTVTDEVEHLLGETALGAPVVIAWDHASASARHPERGHDVTIHEFAHQLDLLDRTVDGTPPLLDEADRDRWIAVCTESYERLEAGVDHVMDPYGATDPGEFFAVAAETFFTVPEALEREEPDLYDVLAGFFGQDPAERRRRHRQRMHR